MMELCWQCYFWAILVALSADRQHWCLTTVQLQATVLHLAGTFCQEFYRNFALFTLDNNTVSVPAVDVELMSSDKQPVIQENTVR